MKRSGFTLIELMIVLAIIAALAAILTPMGMNALNRAKATQIVADVRNIRSAAQLYYFDKTDYPSALTSNGGDDFKGYLDVSELTNISALKYSVVNATTGTNKLITIELEDTVGQGVKDQLNIAWTQGDYNSSTYTFSFDFSE